MRRILRRVLLAEESAVRDPVDVPLSVSAQEILPDRLDIIGGPAHREDPLLIIGTQRRELLGAANAAMIEADEVILLRKAAQIIIDAVDDRVISARPSVNEKDRGLRRIVV